MLKNDKKYYDIVFINSVFSEVTLYFRSIDEIFDFITSDVFSNNVRYVISCYDYRNHKYIYNLRSDNSD